MVTVEPITGVYAKVPNRPGALQNLARSLGQNGVNVDALSAETMGELGIVRFTTRKPREAVDLLRHAGVEAYETEMVLTSLLNKPNQLALAAGDLAASGINVEGVLTTTEGRLAFRTSDNERAAQILRKL